MNEFNNNLEQYHTHDWKGMGGNPSLLRLSELGMYKNRPEITARMIKENDPRIEFIPEQREWRYKSDGHWIVESWREGFGFFMASLLLYVPFKVYEKLK